jgi:hypothetical protein
MGRTGRMGRMGRAMTCNAELAEKGFALRVLSVLRCSILNRAAVLLSMLAAVEQSGCAVSDTAALRGSDGVAHTCRQ